MTKQDKIKEAYGDYFNELKDKISDNGWVSFYEDINRIRNVFHKNENIEVSPNDNNNWRPKSLQGIENNNGWIKIESENDLPKVGDYDMSTLKLMYWTNGGQYEANDYKRWKLHYPHLEISHYQFIPIIKLNEPLY
jgi:hypothetical protein